MRTLIIKLPDSVHIYEQEMSMCLAAKLYEQGKVSLGEASTIAGVAKRTFIELLGQYGVSIFNYPASDLSSDVANA